jgi:hypothetical protein
MIMNKDYDYPPFSSDPELSALQKVARGRGEDATKMKSEISRKLYIMVSDRLFGGRPWNADKEIAAALNRQFTEMGLQQWVPETPGSIRSTALGRELDATLMLVFMGGGMNGRCPRSSKVAA